MSLPLPYCHNPSLVEQPTLCSPEPLRSPHPAGSPASACCKNPSVSLSPTLQMAPVCPLVTSSVDTGSHTSLPRVGGTGWCHPSCTLPVLRQQPWLPFRASLFKLSCLIDRRLGTGWLLCGQHTSPPPSILHTLLGACTDSQGPPER